MVILCIIKCRGYQNFRSDGVIAGGAQIGFKISFAGLSHFSLFGRKCINSGTVLRADIIALTHALGRVVIFPKHGKHMRKAGPRNVENDLHNFIVAGTT